MSVDNNNKQSGTKYSFKLLREEAVDTDVFEDNTHEKIADSLFKLIESKDKGITIGLEGSWGSGKSTVISILRRKLKENNSPIPLIQFDAWAHEGDPLRRIFLESLIDEIKPEVEAGAKLDDLKERIARRKKTIKIKTTHTTTSLGKWLSIAIFFIPIGVAFLSRVDYSTISITGSLYWLFIVGLLLSGAPLLVVIGKLILILLNKDLRKEGIFDLKNWSFLQDEADKDITQEVSEEDERSSIEFERYFNQIMEEIFKDSKISKVIIVVDDLDRIDKHDSLKIWATLQTFLQQRNQVRSKKEWFDKLWIIVPYDPDGLSRLWDKNSDDDRAISKSFFDKCFQLRLEVPKPIFSGWEKFARDIIDQALEGWVQNDKDDLIRVLRITRKRLDDIPTPREIKNYINQVGFLASQWGTIIPISSIAYYVCRRELGNSSVHDIKAKLVNNELIDSKHRALLSETCVNDLSGLVFGVAPEKGVQLLLEPEISAALQNADAEKLNKICERHGRGFWHVFYYHFEHSDPNLEYIISSAKAIYNSIWKDNRDKCNEFINKVIKIDLYADFKEITWSEQNIDKYICLISLCSQHIFFIENTYYYLIDNFRKYLSKDESIDYAELIISLEKLRNVVSNIAKVPSSETIDELTLSKLVPWTNALNSINVDTSKWLKPSPNIVNEINNAIVESTPLLEGLFEAIQYAINAGVKKGWESVLTQCQKYITWNDGTYKNQSDDIFKIINILAFKTDNSAKTIKSIVQSGPYHNLFWHRRTENLINSALLCGYTLKKDLHSIVIPNIGNSTAGFNEIKNFWINSSIDNAKKVFEELKKHNLWSFLWELARDEQNKLVKDIIALALGDEDIIDLFCVKSGLVELKDFSALFEDNANKSEKVSKLIEKFRKHSDLENAIANTEDLDIVEYSYQLYILIEQIKKKKVINNLADKLKTVDKDMWTNALVNDTYLTSLALAIKNKTSKFNLENTFTDAFIEFSNKKQDGGGNYEDWHKDNWSNLISLMGDSFQKHYREKITDFLCDNLLTFSLDSFNLNKEYFLYQNVIDKVKVMQGALEEVVKSENIERLKLLNEILSKDVKSNFKPEKHFSEVMKQPINTLYSKKGNKENKTIIRQIAEKFQLELIENDGDVSIEDNET